MQQQKRAEAADRKSEEGTIQTNTRGGKRPRGRPRGTNKQRTLRVRPSVS